MDRERFDALARLLATPGSRRAALSALLGAGLAGAGVDALAKKGKSARKGRGDSRKRKNRNKVKASSKGNGNLGNSVCAKWCHDTFSGKAAGQCTAAAAKGEGPCYECGPEADPDNGFIFCNGACVEGGCCTNAQCENPTPVCDDDNACVACTANTQCGADGACTCGTASAGLCQEDFFQGFETDTAGWTGGTTRVPSNTNSIPAKTGDFYAQVAQNGGAFTRWGGYTNVFPAGGYETELAIYLDPAAQSTAGTANDTRFDWTSAINRPDCSHRRDFVFNAGYYNDNSGPGSGPRFIFSASNNTGRGNSFPKNPGRDPIAVTASGWYTLRHEFRNNAGVLSVRLVLLDPGGSEVNDWTLSDPSDQIGATVGGNRYGWFASNELPSLAIDDSARQS